MAENYRVTSAESEIENILKASARETDNILWQSIDGKEKTIFKINKIVLNEDRTLVRFYSDFSIKSIDLAMFIYVKLNHGVSLIKAKPIACENGQVTIKFPKEMVTSELRLETRRELPYDDYFTVTLSRPLEITKKSTQIALALATNVTQKGLGLFFKEKSPQFFELGAEVCLEKIGEIGVVRKAKVVHFSKSQCQGPKDTVVRGHRLGLQLVEPLDQQELDLWLQEAPSP